MLTVPRSADSRSDENDSSSPSIASTSGRASSKQSLAVVGQRDPRPAALEQLGAQFLLERLDLQRDRGLAQGQLFGGLGDALGAGGVDKAAELLQSVLLITGGRRGHVPFPQRGRRPERGPTPQSYPNNCLRQS